MADDRSLTRFRRMLCAAGVAVALVSGLLAPAAGSATTTPVADGRTEATAAGSCWEVLQNDPSAQDGVYWLITPTLVAPQQFYCDQTHRGGGWVLIARGREGWTEDHDGLGSATQIATLPSGVAAFAPAQLPADVIDGLLDGGRPDRLDDGVRLRRATSIDGSSWQEVRFDLQRRDRWTWAFGAGEPLKTWVVDGHDGTGGTSSAFGHGDRWDAVSFAPTTESAHRRGWAYGSKIDGTADASSFRWAPAGGGHAVPFAQMFLRPELKRADLDFRSAPGTAGSSVPAMPPSDAMATVWGVSGDTDGQGAAEVTAFGQVGSAVYAGGDFAAVQRTRAGTGRVSQPYLAGFDVTTGEWLPEFRPELNGPVDAIAALPDGRLAVGGRFTRVDGTVQTSLALLDARTGRLAGPQISVEQQETGRVAAVAGLDVQDGHLYIAGSMTALVASDGETRGEARNGGRVDLATGLPDPSWDPGLNGTTLSVDAAARGDRVYFAGSFTQAQTSAARSAAAVETSSGAAVVTPRWAPAFSADSAPAYSVFETGDRVYVAASRRSLAAYDRTTLRLASGSLMRSGQNLRTVSGTASIVIGGCGCGPYTSEYRGRELTAATRALPARAAEVDRMDMVGAWDAATGARLPQWAPRLTSAGGDGVCATFFDDSGALWVGGDLVGSVRVGSVTQWSGGFVRFAPADTSPPTAPSAVASTPSADGAQRVLTWEPSTDATRLVYEVLRDDTVIATTTAPTAVVAVSEDDSGLAVRARDVAGNRSPATPAVDGR